MYVVRQLNTTVPILNMKCAIEGVFKFEICAVTRLLRAKIILGTRFIRNLRFSTYEEDPHKKDM